MSKKGEHIIDEYNLLIVLHIYGLGLEHLKKKQASMQFIREDGTMLTYQEVLYIANDTMKKLIDNTDIKK